MRRRAQWRFWNLTVLFLSAFVAAAIAVWQQSIVIFFLAVFALGAGSLACLRSHRESHRFLALFATGFLVRLIAASFSFLSETKSGTWIARFATDGQGNFDSSQLPLPFTLSTFVRTTLSEDVGVNAPGWHIYNRIVTLASDVLGGAHPLGNLQLQLLGGALVAPILYALAQRAGLRRSGWWAAWIVTLHPMLIAYSAVLIRDEMISMLGFLVVLLTVDVVRTKRGALRGWMLVGITLIALVTLRVPSAVYFAAVAGAFVVALRAPRRRRFKQTLTIAAAVAIAVVIAIIAQLPTRLGAARWATQTELRATGTTGADSIGMSALQGGGVTWIAAGVLLHFIAPFPFFRLFDAPDISFLHYWTGIGGLANQMLLGFFIAGAAIALVRRNRVVLTAVGIAIVFAAASTVTFGDPARYMSAHGAPLVALTAVYGLRRLDGMKMVSALAWFAGLVLIHAVYFFAKGGFPGS